MLQPRRCVLEEFPDTDDLNCQYCYKGCSSNTKTIRTPSKKKDTFDSSRYQSCLDSALDDSFFDDTRPDETGCSCSNEVLAMAYVKPQKLNAHNIYNHSDALRNGTLFPDLTKPFKGGKRNDE